MIVFLHPPVHNNVFSGYQVPLSAQGTYIEAQINYEVTINLRLELLTSIILYFLKNFLSQIINKRLLYDGFGFCVQQVHSKKAISGCQALRQAKAPMAGLKSATAGFPKILGRVWYPLCHQRPALHEGSCECQVPLLTIELCSER
ncbi:hypothetical protein PoB_002238600 [Plakobranchus ocellatus]|uniref:Uncharacterized protein n=1 Tax=Plakobranchus ocellatus TaxID=259542 RepID=A0AAV3ZIV4_9GAST|nr:hypothetical protein PoB_002238600 [Plakobranchus ocellatus]